MHAARQLLLFCLAMTAFGGTLPAAAQPVPPCPPANELRAELRQHVDNLKKLKTGLENFIQGGATADIPISALFMIDPDNAEEVVKRIDALNASLAAPGNDPLLACASATPALREEAQAFAELQSSVSRLRLRFLQQPADKRAALLHPQLEATLQADTVKQLQDEHSSAVAEQKQAAKALARAEQRVLNAESGISRDLNAERAELERVNNELTELKVKWLADMEQTAAYYQQTTERLAEIGRLQPQPETLAELQSDYRHTVDMWRALVDNTPDIANRRYVLKLPELPHFPDKLLAAIGATPDSRKYREAYQETQAFRQDLLETVSLRLQDSIESHYRVLLQSGGSRSQLLNKLLERGDDSPLQLSVSLFADIRREFVIVPYRWEAVLHLRWLDVTRNLHKGWQGWSDIALNFLLLSLFLLTPWAIWLLSKRLTLCMILLRSQLVQLSRSHAWARQAALAIQKFMPYLRWLIMLLGLGVAQYLLALTVLSELALLLPYVSYYVYYRLFRQLMQCDFIWVNRHVGNAQLLGLRRQVDLDVQTVGLAALFIFSLLYAIESLIRRGLIFHVAADFMVYLALAAALWFAYRWRQLLAASLTNLLPWAWGRRFAAACTGHYGLLLALPAFVLVLLLLLMRKVMNWGSRFEFSKKIAAEIFRYQLESASDSKPRKIYEQTVPEAYRKWFTLTGTAAPELLMLPHDPGFTEAIQLIERWRGDPAVNSLAVIGHRGAGKTCLQRYLQRQLHNVRIVSAAVPAKLTSRAEVSAFFEQLLAVTEGDTATPAVPKTVVLIDDAHNLFLARQGGFDGFKFALELINLPEPHVFWCLAFNYHAWVYLNSVIAKHQFFGYCVELGSWPEEDIQNLILSLHAQSGFALSYDDIIQATGLHDLENAPYIENRFFRLLWRQSRGNPRLAVYLWLTTLHRIGDRTLRVGLPDEAKTMIFTNFSEDALFVYASIARHENLTPAQTVEVTKLPAASVRHILELGVDSQLLDCRQDVYRVTPLYQIPLTHYLLAKHFLYE